MKIRQKKPIWLKRNLPTGPEYESVKNLLKKADLTTVCQEAKCPNMWECFSKKTATFMIMGTKCTRNCRFCAVDTSPVDLPDPNEPSRLADAVKKMGLTYVVVTSVTRDDLDDGGASFFAQTIQEIRNNTPDTRVEVLIPDFQGNQEALKKVLDAKPDVLNHNIETISRLYSKVRPEAGYEQSLDLLRNAVTFDPTIPVKSGLMLGLGETFEEVEETLKDLHRHGCKIVTLGQYLQPSKNHLEVERFVTPEEFNALKETALKIGFLQVASGPFVRSSYKAKELFATL